LGYFDTGGKSLEEVRAQFMAGQLPRPGELLVGQAERTEPYRAVLYGGRDSLLFPDLRFDDEM
jgi:hypothetical protein